MSLADVLDGAFKLFKANARTVLLIAAAFIVPVNLIGAFAQRNLLGGHGFFQVARDPSVLDAAAESGPDSGALIAQLVAAAVSLVVLPFVAGAISRVVAASYLGQELGARPAIKATLRRWWGLLAAWFLVHLMELFGFLLCLLPGLLAMALFVAVAPAIVAEELGPIQGMRRSWRLMRPRLFPVLGIALLAGLLSSFLGNALGFFPQAAALLVGLKWGWPLLAAGASLSGIVTTSFVAIVATLLYFDGRIRQEGLDLQVMAAGLAAGAP